MTTNSILSFLFCFIVFVIVHIIVLSCLCKSYSLQITFLAGCRSKVFLTLSSPTSSSLNKLQQQQQQLSRCHPCYIYMFQFPFKIVRTHADMTYTYANKLTCTDTHTCVRIKPHFYMSTFRIEPPTLTKYLASTAS